MSISGNEGGTYRLQCSHSTKGKLPRENPVIWKLLSPRRLGVSAGLLDMLDFGEVIRQGQCRNDVLIQRRQGGKDRKSCSVLGLI